MARFRSAVALTSTLLACSGSLALPTPPKYAPMYGGAGRDEVFERLLEYEHDLLAAVDSDARHEVSVAFARDGFARLEAGEPRAMIYIQMAGIGLFNQGTPHAMEHAVELYQNLTRIAKKDRDIAFAYEMLAKAYARQGLRIDASRVYEQWLAFVTADGGLRGVSGDRFGTTVLEYVALLEMMKKQGAAGEVLGLLAGPYRDVISSNEAQVASAWRARSLAQSGRLDEAVRLWDELLDGSPTLGVKDGKRVSWLMERARLIDPARLSDAYIDELLAIWSDRRLVGTIQHLRVGSALLSALERRGDAVLGASVAMEVAHEAMAQEDHLTATDRSPDPAVFGFVALQRTILLRTMRLGELAEDWPTAIWAADAYASRFNSDSNSYGAHKAQQLRLRRAANRVPPASHDGP